MIKCENDKVEVSGTLATLLTDIRKVLIAIYKQDDKDFELFCKHFFFSLNPIYSLKEIEKMTDKKFEELREEE